MTFYVFQERQNDLMLLDVQMCHTPCASQNRNEGIGQSMIP